MLWNGPHNFSHFVGFDSRFPSTVISFRLVKGLELSTAWRHFTSPSFIFLISCGVLLRAWCKLSECKLLIQRGYLALAGSYRSYNVLLGIWWLFLYAKFEISFNGIWLSWSNGIFHINRMNHSSNIHRTFIIRRWNSLWNCRFVSTTWNECQF